MIPLLHPAYGIVFLAAALCRLALEFLPFNLAFGGQQAVVSWEFFAVFAACYVTAIALASRVNLPGPGESLARPRAALLCPAAVGATVATLTIASDSVAPVAAARGLATIHVEGMAAIPFYAYAAAALTTVFHFLPVALLVFVTLRLPGKMRAATIGAGIAMIAFGEDAGYFLRHALSVAANGAEALLIYRFGFLAGLAQRASTYLVWHILWPALYME